MYAKQPHLQENFAWPLYDASFQYMCHSGGVEHSLSISTDASDVSMGEESLHSSSSAVAGDEEAHQVTQPWVR